MRVISGDFGPSARRIRSATSSWFNRYGGTAVATESKRAG
jgi:hypothetical protein